MILGSLKRSGLHLPPHRTPGCLKPSSVPPAPPPRLLSWLLYLSFQSLAGSSSLLLETLQLLPVLQPASCFLSGLCGLSSAWQVGVTGGWYPWPLSLPKGLVFPISASGAGLSPELQDPSILLTAWWTSETELQNETALLLPQPTQAH